jgi:hypothetical protein
MKQVHEYNLVFECLNIDIDKKKKIKLVQVHSNDFINRTFMFLFYLFGQMKIFFLRQCAWHLAINV